jgi:hypothetical protein
LMLQAVSRPPTPTLPLKGYGIPGF